MDNQYVRTVYHKVCTICGNKFDTVYPRQNICLFKCRQESARERSRMIMRQRRAKQRQGTCEVCGYNETVDRHHEGKILYTLCPNHHALITRGIKTIAELIHK